MAHYNNDQSGYHDPSRQMQRAKRAQTDYGSTYVQWMRTRRRDGTCLEQERPSPSYIVDMIPPAGRVSNPADSLPVKHLHSSLNKIKHPVNVVKWTPEGRRLLTGSSSGEFTLWNGMGFNFETIMQAHDVAIRAAAWTHDEKWLLSADQSGVLKYWNPNFNNLKAIQAHESCIRDIAFAPSDVKFVTASDDSTLKIWDLDRAVEESTLTGHGWDAKTVDWHPTKGLLVSGSKDNQVKLWDPRTGRCLTTLHGHKNTITKAAFEPTRGVLLATSAHDQSARVFDIRMMRDVFLLRGQEKSIMTLCWHPTHHTFLSTGSFNGGLHHYLLDEPNSPPSSSAEPGSTSTTISPYDSSDPLNAAPQTIFPAHKLNHAHELAIWSLDWHPLGHVLASGSNDRITRFWTRARPGDGTDVLADRYHLGDSAAEAHSNWNRRRQQPSHGEDHEQDEDDADALVDQKMPARAPVLPGLPGIAAALQADAAGGRALPLLPGMGAAPASAAAPLPLPGAPFIPLPNTASFPAFDPRSIPDINKLAEMFGGKLPPPPLLGANGTLPPPPSGFNQLAGFGAPPPPPMGGFQLPPGVDAVPAALTANGGDGLGGDGGGAGGRRRAPLPSQQDSLREEMKRGNYRNAR